MLDRVDDTSSSKPVESPSTPLKVAGFQPALSKLPLTPYSQTVVSDIVDYLEKKVVQYRVIDPSSDTLKVLGASR